MLQRRRLFGRRRDGRATRPLPHRIRDRSDNRGRVYRAGHREDQVRTGGKEAPRERRGCANQMESWCGRMSEAVRSRPRRSSATQCSFAVRGGFLNAARWPRTAASTASGSASNKSAMKASGCCAVRPWGSQTVGREVPQVPGHDHVRAAFNRRGQHMEVVGVRQMESRRYVPSIRSRRHRGSACPSWRGFVPAHSP